MTITLTNQTELTLVLNPTPLTRRPPPTRRPLAAELFPEKTPAENVEEFMAWVVATFCSGDREVGCEGLASSIHAGGQNQDQDQNQDRVGQKRFRPLDWEREGERERERESKARRMSRWEDARWGEAGGYEYQQQQQEQYRRYTVAGQYGYMYGDGYYWNDRRWSNWGNGYNDGRQYDHYYGGGVSHEDGHRYHRRNSDYGGRNHGHDHRSSVNHEDRHDHRNGANREDTRPQANFRSETIDTNYNTNTTNIQPQEATATTFSIPVAGANILVTQPQENPTAPTAPTYFIPAATTDNATFRSIPTAQEEHPTSRNVRTKISYRQRNAYKDHQYQQRHRSSNSTVPDLYPPVTTRSGAYARPEEYEASRARVKEEEEQEQEE